MDITLTDVVLFLRDNGYTTTRAGKLCFTQKFHDDHATQRGVVNTTSVAKTDQQITLAEGLSKAFMNFIMDAKVPSRLEDNRGNPYYVNKYNEDAAKAFTRMIANGISYELLVKSTMLYYKSGVKFKKAIGNYILQGDWRTDYEELRASAEQGSEQIKNHINQTLDNGQHNPFSLG